MYVNVSVKYLIRHHQCALTLHTPCLACVFVFHWFTLNLSLCLFSAAGLAFLPREVKCGM